MYASPCPNSAEAEELAKAKLKVRQQRELRAKNIRNKKTNSLVGQALPITTFGLNGNLANFDKRTKHKKNYNRYGDRPRRKSLTHSSWYGDKQQQRANKQRFKDDAIKESEPKIEKPSTYLPHTSRRLAALHTDHGADVDTGDVFEEPPGAFSNTDSTVAPMPIQSYNDSAPMPMPTPPKREDNDKDTTIQDTRTPVPKPVRHFQFSHINKSPAGKIPILSEYSAASRGSASGRTSPISPVVYRQREEYGHAGHMAPNCSPVEKEFGDVAYEQLARNINSLASHSPMQHRVNVLSSNASRWLKQQPAAPLPPQRKKSGLSSILIRMRENRDASRQMSRERAIRLLNNVL